MLDKNDSNAELKVRVLKMEIKEAKRQADKDYDMMCYSIITCIVSVIFFPYFYFVRQEKELWKVISFVIILLLFPLIGFYCFNCYKKKKR